MRKIKILITAFVIMVVLSMDLGTVFSGTSHTDMQTEKTAEDEGFCSFSNLQYNVGCIKDCIVGTMHKKVADVADQTASQYAEAVADKTTKAVENAIKEDQKKD